MAFNVIGLFDNPRDAQAAAQELRDTGFSGNDIRDSYATAGAAMGTAAGGLIDALIGTGVPEGDANIYAEGVHRGGSLLSVQVDDEQAANRAAAIMDQHHVVDIDRRGAEFRQAGWTHFDPNATPYAEPGHAKTEPAVASTAAQTARVADPGATGVRTADVGQGGPIKVPVVEEALAVGKRTVEQGGVRVYTRVVDVPVSEQVTLRDETVQVQRRPVDRPVTDTDLAGIRQGTVEVRERDEVPVVDKQARIVEEVVIKKDVDQRTETVHDTVRHTNVQVEELPEHARAAGLTQTAPTATPRSAAAGITAGADEGMLERGASQVENAAERLTKTDLNRDGDVGQHDPRNNG
jgi:stress response protein YsnF